VSFLKRVRDLLIEDVPDPAPPPPPEPPSAPPEPDPFEKEIALLSGLAAKVGVAVDDERSAIEAFERLREGSREILAIDLARALLARGDAPALRCRVAEALDARGDEDGAREVLAPFA
jgi:hypothetical protein